MKIYGDLTSGNCLKVQWTTDWLGLAYDWIEIDIMRGESRTPDFLAMNPAGQAPLIVLDDGRPLAQSNAIILYLAEASDLIPQDPYERAKMLEWLFWEQYSHEPYVAVARFQVRYLGKPVAELEEKLVKRSHSALQRMEDGLATQLFLVGDHMTLADISLIAYTRMAHEGGLDLSPYPRLKTWIARVEDTLGLPAYPTA